MMAHDGDVKCWFVRLDSCGMKSSNEQSSMPLERFRIIRENPGRILFYRWGHVSRGLGVPQDSLESE